jgi:hypothetical protein
MYKIGIVSGADSKYFNLLVGLLTSLKDWMPYINKKTPDFKLEFLVMDGGLRKYELDFLKEEFQAVVKPIELKFKDLIKTELPLYYNSFIERPRIPHHFPGYSGYIWLDSDVWVQDGQAIVDILNLMDKGYAAIVSEVDRHSAFNHEHMRITRGWSYGNYSKFFGAEVAAKAVDMPMINSGVVGAHAFHPLWDHWAELCDISYLKVGQPDFGVDQITLNAAIYFNKLKVYPLPMLYNWPCTHSTPVEDVELGLLKTCLFPHELIKIVHMLDHTKWNRQAILRFDALGNQSNGSAKNLEYFEWRPNVLKRITSLDG